MQLFLREVWLLSWMKVMCTMKQIIRMDAEEQFKVHKFLTNQWTLRSRLISRYYKITTKIMDQLIMSKKVKLLLSIIKNKCAENQPII